MSNYTAVITGGSKGIGADLAQRLLERGYRVISIARGKPEWEAEGAQHVEADLLDPASVAAVAADIAARYDVTHLVHNAGLIWPNLIEDAKPKDITGLAQLHLGSALTLLQAFLPAMKERGFGRVINTTSGIKNQPEQAGYSASKAALDNFTTDLGTKLDGTGVLINLTDPGWCRTDLGGPQAPNAPESSIPGVAVGAFVDGGKNGRFLNAANFADMSLEDAVKKAATL